MSDEMRKRLTNIVFLIERFKCVQDQRMEFCLEVNKKLVTHESRQMSIDEGRKLLSIFAALKQVSLPIYNQTDFIRGHLNRLAIAEKEKKEIEQRIEKYNTVF